MCLTYCVGRARLNATANPADILLTGSCEGFAVDWLSDRIFWVNCQSNRYTMNVANLDGKNVASLFSRTWDKPRQVDRMDVDPYSR